MWPRWVEHPGRPIFELGPVLGPRFPLLTDAQIIGLLCEGCPFDRPAADDLVRWQQDVDLDVHDSHARMRAILSASIFYEWRHGTHAREHELRTVGRGFGCRLAHCRASMGRLIAGLNVHMFPQGPEPEFREPLVYDDDACPAAEFTVLPPPREPAPPAAPGGPGPGPGPAPVAAQADGGPRRSVRRRH